MSQNFFDLITRYPFPYWEEKLKKTTSADVEKALARAPQGSIEDFVALISPAAEPYLDEMAQLSKSITQRRFGKVIQMYIPMYLSNECKNICTYCGFSMENKIPRITLTLDQIQKEVEEIKKFGFEHILLVTGEENHKVGVPYFKQVLEMLSPQFSNLSLEVQPLLAPEYQELMEYNLNTVYLYQETYHPETYAKVHPKGKKSLFQYRINAAEELGKAEIYRIGLGSLLGLNQWRVEAIYLALHLEYLEQKFWKSKFSLSFPRLRPAAGDYKPEIFVSLKNFFQLICAYRLVNEHVELSLSTRESPKFRDFVLPYGITSMSAGSKTNPGGYAENSDSLEQFSISDHRDPLEIAQVIQKSGYEPVWKDWDRALCNPIH